MLTIETILKTCTTDEEQLFFVNSRWLLPFAMNAIILAQKQAFSVMREMFVKTPRITEDIF